MGSAGGVRVFENNGRVPRAFVTEDVHEVGGMADAVSYLTSLGHTTEDGTTHVDLFDPPPPGRRGGVGRTGERPPPFPAVQAEGWAIPLLAIVCLGAVALFSWFFRLGARRREVVMAEEP
jgi:hypothetical protein